MKNVRMNIMSIPQNSRLRHCARPISDSIMRPTYCIFSPLSRGSRPLSLRTFLNTNTNAVNIWSTTHRFFVWFILDGKGMFLELFKVCQLLALVTFVENVRFGNESEHFAIVFVNRVVLVFLNTKIPPNFRESREITVNL